MMAEGGGAMEIGLGVEMTVMWGVEMVTDGEEIGEMTEVSGGRIERVTDLHATMIVIGKIEVAMVTDKMTEIVEGAGESRKRRWMRKASSLSADELDL